MSQQETTQPVRPVVAQPLRTPAILTAAMLVAVAVNTLVAVVAKSLGANPGFAPLSLAVYGPFTVIGVLVGWLGWWLIQRRAAHPDATLRVLVPVMVVVSWAPDLTLLVLRFIPETSTAGVLGLMIMHLVVAGVAVPAYAVATKRSAKPSSRAAQSAPHPVTS